MKTETKDGSFTIIIAGITGCCIFMLLTGCFLVVSIKHFSNYKFESDSDNEVFVISDKIYPVESHNIEEPIEAELIIEEDTSYQEYDYQNYYYKPVYYEEYYEEPQADGVLTASCGVNYYNGNRETWYSSNVLYHNQTGEWTCGDDGIYRDSEGYVIVASSDLDKGSVVDTSLGEGKVYDSGCASGTIDIYTNW